MKFDGNVESLSVVNNTRPPTNQSRLRLGLIIFCRRLQGPTTCWKQQKKMDRNPDERSSLRCRYGVVWWFLSVAPVPGHFRLRATMRNKTSGEDKENENEQHSRKELWELVRGPSFSLSPYLFAEKRRKNYHFPLFSRTIHSRQSFVSCRLSFVFLKTLDFKFSVPE